MLIIHDRARRSCVSLREGAKGVLDPRSKVPQGSLAPSETCFALVQPYFAPVQQVFLLPGSKRPFAPSRNHFREFPGPPSPKRLGLQLYVESLQNLWTLVRLPSFFHTLGAVQNLSNPQKIDLSEKTPFPNDPFPNDPFGLSKSNCLPVGSETHHEPGQTRTLEVTTTSLGGCVRASTCRFGPGNLGLNLGKRCFTGFP